MQQVIRKLKVIGDSILKGIQVNHETDQYYVHNTIDSVALGQEFGLQIENYSRFGCTVTKASQLLEKQLAKHEVFDIALMDFGGNDCDFDWQAVNTTPDGEHLAKTPPQLFQSTYVQMIKTLKEHGVRPIIMTLPPIMPQLYLQWFCRKLNLQEENLLHWLGDVNTIYRYQELYSKIVEQIAYEQQISLIDVRALFLNQLNLRKYLCEDGIHPNSEGQALMEQAFRSFMLREQEQSA